MYDTGRVDEGQKKGFLVKSVGLVMMATILSRVLGFFREMAVAYRFGTSMEADAYLVAMLLPTILFYSFGDALKSTFITVFAPFKKESSAPHFLNTLALYLAGILLLLVVLGLLFTPQLVFILAPGFEDEAYSLTVKLTRILVPGIFIMGLSGLATGFLHSHYKFLIPALVNVPHNIIVICSALFLGLRYGVVGLAWGSLFAIASQLLIQLPSLRRTPFQFRAGLSPRHPGLQKIFSLLPAILLSSAVLELKHLIDRLFGSFLPSGSIAALNYAERIYMLPQAVFISAIIIILYPTLVDHYNRGQLESFTQKVRQGISLVIFLLLPIAAGTMILRRPLVEFLFQRGAFDAAGTELTSYALLFYAPGIVGFALHCYCSRIFFALQEVRVLALLNIAMVGSNALFNYFLMAPMAHGGIALGTALSFILGSLVLLVLLTRRLKQLSFSSIFLLPFLRAAAATVLMCASICCYLYLRSFLGQPFSGLGVIFIVTALGGGVYFLGALLLRSEEAMAALAFLKDFKGFKGPGKSRDSRKHIDKDEQK